MDGDDLEARLEAVERALADGDTDLSEVTDAARRSGELDDLRDRIEDLESRVTDLAAGVQAVRGYVGNVRRVNRDVERRADAALAKVEELQRHETDPHTPEPDDGTGDSDGAGGAASHRDAVAAGNDSPTGRTSGAERDSPGEIARRITGRESDRTGDGRQLAGRRERTGRRRERRSEGIERGPDPASSERAESGSDDGFLAGLRDAL